MMISLKRKNIIFSYLYILFLLSTLIKVVFIYLGLNFIDLTVFFALLISFDLLLNIFNFVFNNTRKNIIGFLAIGLFFLFFLLCIISLLTTASEGYSYEKVLVMNINALILIYPFFNEEISLDRIKKLLIIIVVPLSIWFAYLFNFRWSGNLENIDVGRFELIRASYLSFSMWLGILVLILAHKENFIRNRVYIFLLLFLILLMGARGPLIFVLVLLFFNKYLYLSFLQRYIKINRFLFSVGSLIMLVVAIVIFHELILTYFGVGINRFKIMFETGRGLNSRTELLNFSFYKIFNASTYEFLMGHGIGSFNFYYEGVDAKYYPHNILVEAWFELGFVGFIVLLSFLSLPFFKRDSIIPLSIILYLILNAMKTSSFVDVRVLYGFYAMYLFSKRSQLSEIKNIKPFKLFIRI